MSRLRCHAPLLGALAVSVLLLAGCATPDESAVKPAAPAAPMGQPAPVAVSKPPPPPPPVVQLPPATITGSEESSTMFDNFTVYVRTIDGVAVEAGRAGWNTPLALKAGPHRLSLAFIRGAFTAQMVVQINAQPKRAYQLKFATDAHLFGKNSYCEFWIEDTTTGEKVLAPARVPLSKIEPGQ